MSMKVCGKVCANASYTLPYLPITKNGNAVVSFCCRASPPYTNVFGMAADIEEDYILAATVTLA